MISIVVRALNEEKYLLECLKAIKSQKIEEVVEIIVVDSGSTDRTIEIALSEKVRLVKIKKCEFSFGRSLNMGTYQSAGDIVVYLSAHCVPTDGDWLSSLIRPIQEGNVDYSYGRQLPRTKVSKFSEGQVFAKYFPAKSAVPQAGYFCNNANSALKREVWEQYKFDEDLTGLEDMELAKRLVQSGKKIGYVATSTVEHIHEEVWPIVRKRYEREAIALASIDPSLRINFWEALYLIYRSVLFDSFSALTKGELNKLIEIMQYRYNQYRGSYRGSKLGSEMAKIDKTEYFYPHLQIGAQERKKK